MAKQAITFAPAGLSKKERKELEEYLKSLSGPQAEDDAAATGIVDPLPTLHRKLPTLPSFWTLPLRRPFHRATGFQIAAANPFAAADIHDPAGPIIGIEMMSGGGAFTFDPWTLYSSGLVSSPNLLIEGSLRQGKSFWIKRLVALLVEVGHYAINTSDSKGEHGVVAQALGGDVFELGAYGSDIRINPLEKPERRNGETVDAYQSRVKAGRNAVLQQIATLLNPGERAVTAREASLLDWAVDEVVRKTDDRPVIRDVWQELSPENIVQAQGGNHYEKRDADDLWDGLRRLVEGDLGEMFDVHSSVTLRPDCPYTVIDTSAISQRGSGALSVAQAVSNAWVQNTISNKSSGRRYFVIREEGWRDMKSVAALEAHQEQLKLSGEYGISMVLIVHEGGDFDAVGAEGSKERELAKSLLRGYANRVCFNQPQSALNNAVKDGTYTTAEAAAIGGLQRGQFLIKMRNRSYVVDGNPTTTPWEREVFNTDRQMVKQEEDAA
ncbi:hypothetical protein JSO19_03865 [Leucobacter sp. UCMA 4100]|uniref:hypothetical protein n=1 Tax=Leucobacter sp. UCMA 4100 TaxID=2810534 RepID=UPI0022EB2D6F|nr:hypothetical protein [Leucobacter sp. UCMA 4100]MDA3146512.1 hypothetical protein [Leucobacter sp. UCMA 4100]